MQCQEWHLEVLIVFKIIRVCNFFLALLIVVVSVLPVILSGCSGKANSNSPNVPGIPGQEIAVQQNMPQIPIGETDVRQGTVIDSDNVQGSAFFDSFGATPDGSAALIEAGTTPADILAYGVYPACSPPRSCCAIYVECDWLLPRCRPNGHRPK